MVVRSYSNSNFNLILILILIIFCHDFDTKHEIENIHFFGIDVCQSGVKVVFFFNKTSK